MKEVTTGGAARRKVVAIITARGGSRGIPGKNLADLGGKPLIAHSILAALNCALINRVIVSTDSEEIAAVSRQWGAETPFMRPASLSGDTASIGDVVQHALQALRNAEGYAPEAYVNLYPTHPFRSRELMQTLTAKLLEGYRNVRTVRVLAPRAFSHFVPSGSGGLRSLDEDGRFGSRLFYRNYGLYVGARCQGGTREFYLRPLRTEAELIDIDEPQHLCRANELICAWDPEAATPRVPAAQAVTEQSVAGR
ncbi:acylneuraminate cytidylyltransferase family protein [Humidesulfovibrio idahonensis]